MLFRSTTYYSISQDMFGDLTTVTLGYTRAWDQIFRDIKQPDGEIVNDPTFHERADHRSYSLGISQILTRNLIADFKRDITCASFSRLRSSSMPWLRR